MTPQLYALSVVAVALGVILIYGAALAVVSVDTIVWRDDRQAIAQKVTYWLCLGLAIAAFALWDAA